MLKKSLLLIFIAVSFLHAQSTDDFGGSGIINNNRYKWKTPTGTGASSNGSMQMDGSGNASPYHASGSINYGYIYYDSLLTPPFESYVVISQLTGASNLRYFAIGAMNNAGNMTSACGYFAAVHENISGTADVVTLKQMTSGMASLTGNNPFGGSTIKTANKTYVVTDTVGILVRANGNFQVWTASAGGARDTLETNEGLYSLGSGARVWIGGGMVSPGLPDFKVTMWGVRAVGGGSPPPPAADNVKPTASFFLSSSNTYTGTGVSATVTASDDSAGNQSIVEADSGTGWKTITTYTVAGTSTSWNFTSANFTRYTVGTTSVRIRTSDHNKNNAAIRYDTTATQTITFSTAPVITNSGKKIFGWTGFDNVIWPPPYSNSNAMIPCDSLPWDVLTHVGLFATSGTPPNTPRYTAQYPYFAARAHQSGVYAGLTIGGSGDAGFATYIGNSANWPAWFAEFLPMFDNARMDFFEFDLEGTYTISTLGTFIHQLYDSLNVSWRSCGNNASKKPFIVMTLGSSRANSWRSYLQPYTEFVNIMSYDYAQVDTWGRLVFDCAPTSYQYFNGTGTNTDYFAGMGANAPAPSMQEIAKRAIAAGWTPNQVVVGFDVMPGYFSSTNTTAGARGPLTIRQAEPIIGLVDNFSNPTFASLYSQLIAIPSDSIHYDQIANTYWAHTGAAATGGAATTDRVWTFTAMPGRDSTMWATRRVVDSMNIGGVAFWNLTEEIWKTPSVPTGGRMGWLSGQIRTHFGSRDTTIVTLNPPTTFTPANGATGVSVAVTFDWNDVASATGYHLQVDTLASFGSVTKTVDDNALAVSQKVLSLSSGKTYYARVRTKSGASTFGAWSNTIAFTTLISVPGSPILQFPTNGATGQSATIVLAWLSAAGATSYAVQVDSTDATFTHKVTDLSGLTAITRSVNLATGKTYYWRVGGTNAAGNGPWSTIWSFSTATGKPGQAILSAPANGIGGQDTNNLRFVWGAGTAATSYRIQISLNANFSSTVKDTLTSLLGYSAWGLQGSKTYYWRVNDYNSTDTSGYTAAWSFTTTTQGQPILPRLNGQFPYVWDILINGVNLGQPPRYFGMRRGATDGSDIPLPPDSIYDYWSKDGVKRSDGVWIPAGTSSSSSGIKSGDTVQTLRVKNLIVENQLTIVAPVANDTNQKATVKIAPSASQAGTMNFTTPPKSGEPVLQGSDAAFNTVTSNGPVDQPSGGFGINPATARSAGWVNGVWGYLSSSGTAVWSFLPYTDLPAYLKLVSYAGVASGAKVPILTPSGVVLVDSNYWRDAGAGGTNLSDATEDTMKNWVHVRASTIPDTAGFRFYDHTAAGPYRGSIYADDSYFGLFSGASNFPAVLYGTDAGVRAYGNTGTDIIQGTAAERILRLRSTQAAGSAVEEHLWSGKATTTDATITQLVAINLGGTYQNVDYSAWNTTYAIEAEVYASRTDTTNGDGYLYHKKLCLVRNDGGTVSLYNDQTVGTPSESTGSMDVVQNITGTSYRIQVTGVAAQSYTWHALIKIRPLRY